MSSAAKPQMRNYKAIKPDFENHTTIINFLLTMSETVQSQIEKAIEALLTRNEGLAGAVAMYEPRVNALEVVIDEHAVRTIVDRSLPQSDVRLIVATIKINNDLERIADHSTNIAEDVIFWIRGVDVRHNRLRTPHEDFHSLSEDSE